MLAIYVKMIDIDQVVARLILLASFNDSIKTICKLRMSFNLLLLFSFVRKEMRESGSERKSVRWTNHT